MNNYLGIDCGSVSLKFALIRDGNTQGKVYLKNSGLIPTIKEGLRLLPEAEISGVGITGSGKEFVKGLLGADYIDSEIMAHITATLKQYPKVKTVLDIGGEDSKLMLLKDGILSDFQMNKDCGGGTGSMIETIATRLGVKIEDVGRIALESRNPANLPGKCLTAENHLLTTSGLKSIKDVQQGDYIISDGKFSKVTDTFRRQYSGRLFRLYRRYSSEPLVLTEGHPLLVVRGQVCPRRNDYYICRRGCAESRKKMAKGRCGRFYEYYKLEWVNVEDLRRTDLIISPKFSSNSKHLDPALARLVGYYLAEGYCYEKKYKESVEFGFNKKEIEYISDVENLMLGFFGANPSRSFNGNGIKLRFSSRKATDFFRVFGTMAYEKRLPIEYLSADRVALIELLKGYFRGDGSLRRRDIKCNTVSRNLFEQVCVILEKCGYAPRKGVDDKRIGKVVSQIGKQKIIKRRPLYEISLGGRQAIEFLRAIDMPIPSALENRMYTYQEAIINDGYIAYPVRKIEAINCRDIPVYNLEVENQHSYLSNGFLCHNCGIFAQSAVVSELNKGRPLPDILMGVCRALVGNYLAVLAKGKRLLPPIVFQGATALNAALVKCFEDELGSPILVPKDCSFMGAIGIAELTREQMGNGAKSSFRGISNIINSTYHTEISQCNDCENRCELLSLYCNEELLGRSGSRCEKNNI